MIAILNSLSLRLYISVLSGLISGCLSFSFWSGDLIYFLEIFSCQYMWIYLIVSNCSIIFHSIELL